MKTIDISTKSALAAHLSKLPKDTHTKEELDQLHACIRYTQQFKQAESFAKMDEEESIVRPLPDIGRFK